MLSESEYILSFNNEQISLGIYCEVGNIIIIIVVI